LLKKEKYVLKCQRGTAITAGGSGTPTGKSHTKFDLKIGYFSCGLICVKNNLFFALIGYIKCAAVTTASKKDNRPVSKTSGYLF